MGNKPEENQEQGHHRLRLPYSKLILVVILGLAIHLILPQIASLEKSWQVVSKMKLWAVGLAALAQAASYLSYGYLVKQILEITGKAISVLRGALVVLGSASVGMVAGGFVGSAAAIYRWTSGGEGSKEGAALAGILPSLFNNLVLLGVSFIGLIHLILVHNLSHEQMVGFGLTLVFLGVIIGAIILAVRHQEKGILTVNRFFGFFARLLHKTHDAEKTEKQLRAIFDAWSMIQHGRWQTLLLGAGLNVAFDILTLYFMFIAAGNDISLGVLLSGYGLPLLLGKMAFFLPGGVGVVESGMAALYSGLGILSSTAVVAILGYRLISFWIPSLIGFPVAAYLQKTVNQRR